MTAIYYPVLSILVNIVQSKNNGDQNEIRHLLVVSISALINTSFICIKDPVS